MSAPTPISIGSSEMIRKWSQGGVIAWRFSARENGSKTSSAPWGKNCSRSSSRSLKPAPPRARRALARSGPTKLLAPLEGARAKRRAQIRVAQALDRLGQCAPVGVERADVGPGALLGRLAGDEQAVPPVLDDLVHRGVVVGDDRQPERGGLEEVQARGPPSGLAPGRRRPTRTGGGALRWAGPRRSPRSSRPFARRRGRRRPRAPPAP